MYLLDTNVDPANLLISSITVFELEYSILPFSSEDAVTAGRIRGYLERRGTPIGPYDIQIAAQGVSRGITVITHNIGEFSRVPSLSLEDWII